MKHAHIVNKHALTRHFSQLTRYSSVYIATKQTKA